MVHRTYGGTARGPAFEPMEPRLLLDGDLIITEFMADNRTTLADQKGNYPDWLEIYNPTGAAVNLSGYALTDKPGDLGQWRFPDMTLGAGEYLVVFASGNSQRDPAEPLHTNFSLKADGEYLALTRWNGSSYQVVFDFPNPYPPQVADVSYGLSTEVTTTTVLAAGASAKYLVPTSDALGLTWTDRTFSDAGWASGTTGLGYQVTPTLVGGSAFYYAPFGPNGTWNLYEVVSTSRSWIAAYNDALARTQGGVAGHLVTIHSAAENAFVANIITSTSWIGLTDSDTFAGLGAYEAGNTSADPLPPEGQVPGPGQRGRGFVWTTGQPFTYQRWNSNQPDDASPGQDGGAIRTDGWWQDDRNGESVQTGTNRYYVVEYDLGLALPANFVVLEARGGTLNNTTDAINALATGGLTYAARFVNYSDPEATGGTRFRGNLPFGGNTAAADDDFALRVTGTVRIPTAGQWTFGVNSDDGFRLKILGATFTSVTGSGTTINGDTMEYAGVRGSADSLGVTTLTAGDYRVELVYFERGGGAGVEFFAAPGAKTAFDTDFRLIGDTANGGLAVLGINDVRATDLQAAMLNQNASVYLRVPFTVTDPADVGDLTLRMQYNDGFVVYVNGVEAVRVAAPETVTWNSAATAERPAGLALEYETFSLSEVVGNLVAGTNVLAIHGLNRAAGNANFYACPELVTTSLPTIAGAAHYFVLPTPGDNNVAGTAELGPVVTDVSTPPAPPADDQPILVTALVRPALSPVVAGSVTLRYRVMYGSEVALTMYDDGLHGDGAAGDNVYGATIPADAAGPGQMVRWYVTAQDTAARTGRWPLAVPADPYSTNAWPEYEGTVVADPALASTLPILQWFVENPGAATTRTGTRCSLYFLGEFYDNVYVRDRGGYTTDGWKFEFNRGFNFRFAEGEGRVDEFNLNYTSRDDAYIRSELAYNTHRDAGVPYCLSFPMRVQQNGVFHRVAVFVEQVDEDFLDRQGLYADGALYKLTTDRPHMWPADVAYYEKKSRLDEGTADLAAFFTGLHLAGDERVRFLFDHVDLPSVITYLAANILVNDNDNFAKNFYLYRDTQDPLGNPNGTGEWTFLPWDKDLTFGKHYGIADYAVRDPQAHPFFGDSEHPKIDKAGQYNGLIDAVLDTPAIKEMYLRRLRTVLDELLQTADTPYADRYFEASVDEMYARMSGDPVVVAYTGDLASKIADIKALYLDARRYHLFVDHSANPDYPDYAGIPAEQAADALILFGAFDASPASGNQDEEYLELVNPNAFAVDLSGWTLEGGVQYTFRAGAVIPAGGSLYVSPNVAAFRARTTGPGGGQGLFVQGNYEGHLSAWGETVRLVDARGRQVASLTTPATPSDAQRYLRITEIMYHPANPPGGSPYNDEDFEFIELLNTGPATLSLAGVRFTSGVAFDFTTSAVTSLAPGAKVLVVARQAAFVSRYGSGLNGIIAGEFAPMPGSSTGSRLDNGGERISLDDAAGNAILNFTYDDDWYPQTDGEGISLVIRDPAGDRALWDSKSGWRGSWQVDGNPGADDPAEALNPGAVVINEVLAHTDQPTGDWIELRNTTGSPVAIGGWYLSDDPAVPLKYRIAPGTTIPALGHVTFTQANHFGGAFALSELGEEVVLSSSPAAGVVGGYREIEAFGASDREVTLGRYIKSTGGKDFVAMSAPTFNDANAAPLVGPVVFSEILYHPADGGDAFLELRNLTGSAVPLYDTARPANTWMFTDGITFRFPTGAVLPAYGYALVVGGDPAAFRAKYAVPGAVEIYGAWTGGLSNAGEAVELARPGEPDPGTGFVPYYRVDRLTYDDDPPWPVEADGRGPSLIRLVASAYGNDVANWQAGRAGGTPGTANVAFDPTPPSILTGLAATPVTASRVDLAWDPAADPDSGVAGYRVYRNGLLLTTTTGTSLSLVNVYPSITYTYEVAALNRDGVESARGTPAAARIVSIGSASAWDALTVRVVFTERMGRDSAQEVANYIVLDGGGQPLAVTEALLQPDHRIVHLTLAAPLAGGVTHAVLASGVVARSGYAVQAGAQAQFSYTAPVPGNVLREWWTGISGDTVTSLTSHPAYPYDPTGWDEPTLFEAPTNWADAYGQRMRAYVTAPQTGNYYFYIASDDYSELWLSTNENPASAVKIAYVNGWTNSRQWDKFTSQKSAAIYLVTGQRYYIEALQKEGGGGDNLAVGWQLPDLSYERPIPAGRLTVYVPTPPATVSLVASTPTAAENGQQKGVFTLTRTGYTAGELKVYYTVSGTSRTGDVVEELTGTAVFPAGVTQVTLDVTPVDDAADEADETVWLRLIPDRRYAVAAGSATVTILDNELPRVASVELNARPGRGPSAVDPSGAGVRTLDVAFNEAVTFAAADVLVQTVAFPGGVETVTGTLTPESLAGSGTDRMTITLTNASAVDTWVKVTLRGSGTLRDVHLHRLDGEAPAGGNGYGYIYDALDLPTGNGVPGGDAVFYVGSLRGDLDGDRVLSVADVDAFLLKYGAGDLDADFRGAGFGVQPPDGLVTRGDVAGFLAAYQAGAAAGRHLDPLPVGGGGMGPTAAGDDADGGPLAGAREAPAPEPLLAAEALPPAGSDETDPRVLASADPAALLDASAGTPAAPGPAVAAAGGDDAWWLETMDVGPLGEAGAPAGWSGDPAAGAAAVSASAAPAQAGDDEEADLLDPLAAAVLAMPLEA